MAFSARALAFGRCFSQKLDECVWPSSMRSLLHRGKLPNKLELGTNLPHVEALKLLGFQWDSDDSFKGVKWPVTLKKLSIPRGVGFAGMDLPRGVQVDWD